MRFIVNHGGVVHAVNDADLALALEMASITPGPDRAAIPAREATDAEISAYYAAMGLVYDPETSEAHAPAEEPPSEEPPSEEPPSEEPPSEEQQPTRARRAR